MIRDPSLVFYADLSRHDGTVFMSDDAYGHTCTVTGALWRPDGRYFDGTATIIETVANFRSGDSAGTMLCWFKTSATGYLITSADEATGASYYMGFIVISGTGLRIDQKNNDVADQIIGDVDVADGNWHMGAVTSSGATYAIYTDGLANGLSIVGGANTGDWFADTPNRDNLVLGAIKYNATATYLTGNMGGVWIYNRILTPQEILHNYISTKWRYQ